MRKAVLTLTLGCILIIYLPLLLSSGVGGDTTHIFDSMSEIFQVIPYSWSWSPSNGFGGFVSPFTSSHLLTLGIVFYLGFLSLPWNIVIQLIFVIPFLIIGYFSSLFFGRLIYNSKNLPFFTPIIFLLNTYILMLISGGQYVVALSYSLTPLVFFFVYRLFSGFKFKAVLLAALVISLQVMFDLRIAYISIFSVGLYIIYLYLSAGNRFKSENVKRIITCILGVITLTILLQMFWLLPTILKRDNPLTQLGSAYTSENAVSYFSFAKFENSISLLHPNWPENIFGQTYFMKPEFIVLSILAFSALLFIRVGSRTQSTVEKNIIFFTLLSLVGAFLAKGTNEPFGFIYQWLFDNFPGFIMFRDPTKWYTIIALSFSILIPYSIRVIYLWLKKIKKIYVGTPSLTVSNLFLLSLIFFFFYILHPGFLWNLPGTFSKSTIPHEYQELERFLSQQGEFFRILWVPMTQRFSYVAPMHPAVNARDFFASSDIETIGRKLKDRDILKTLQEGSIRYIIIPSDTEGEIFLVDRKYDHSLYRKVVNSFNQNIYIKKVQQFGDVIVYQIPNAKKHIWSTNTKSQISEKKTSPVNYEVNIKNGRKGDRIIFAESYDPGWIGRVKNSILPSELYYKHFNSFVLPQSGSYQLEIEYLPQKYVNIGLVISGSTFILILLILTFSNYKPRILPRRKK